MTTHFIWLGLTLAIAGIVVPFPFFWTDLRKVRIVLLSDVSSSMGVSRLPADLWAYTGMTSVVVLVSGYVFLGTWGVSLSGNFKPIYKPITQIAGNRILLDYDPQPESVCLIVNGKQYYAQIEPGLHLQGRKLTLENVEGSEPLLKIVQEDAPKGSVMLVYHRATP